jgi:hypothetical protein
MSPPLAELVKHLSLQAQNYFGQLVNLKSSNSSYLRSFSPKVIILKKKSKEYMRKTTQARLSLLLVKVLSSKLFIVRVVVKWLFRPYLSQMLLFALGVRRSTV